MANGSVVMQSGIFRVRLIDRVRVGERVSPVCSQCPDKGWAEDPDGLYLALENGDDGEDIQVQCIPVPHDQEEAEADGLDAQPWWVIPLSLFGLVSVVANVAIFIVGAYKVIKWLIAL